MRDGYARFFYGVAVVFLGLDAFGGNMPELWRIRVLLLACFYMLATISAQLRASSRSERTSR